ncbi:hypothetical protein VKT23_002506 [Stygiomarasmius scandens]|uniref:Uncharacterized protein n=1 Tax=Marasmiellus scandens TaxID=2682957 RepID=A0ABR1K891_9AGAR
MATFEDPVIYILSLFQERFMSGTWSNLFAAMEEDAQVSPPIESVAELRLRMNTKKPTAILVIDAGITQPRFETVLNELVEYTKSGGTVVCCCNFTGDLSSSGRPFFSNWDLPWDFSQYCRHSVILTATAASGLSQSNISQLEQTTFRYKLTSLVDVLPEHSLYKSGDIQTETRNGVLIPSDPRETVVAYAPVGRGYLGYVGDANNLDFSSKAIMAMCRLPVEAFVPEPQDERYTLHWTEDGNFQATPSMGTSSTLSSGFGRDAQNYQFTFGQSDPAVIYTSATTNYAGSSRYNQPGPSASTSGRRARPREAEVRVAKSQH